jgi:glutathione S-transferase
MTQLVIFGPAASSYVRTARMTCFEKAVPHTVEPVELGSEAHAKLHPWHRVPSLRHGDVRLYETSAIARYVDEIGTGASLVPTTAPARAVMEQWISAINCYLYNSAVKGYALKYILPKLRGQDPDPKAIAAGVPDMERDVALLDRGYAQGSYLAGDTVSLADLFVAPIAQTIGMFPEGKAALAKAKHLSRAYEQLARRDSFAQAHAGIFG